VEAALWVGMAARCALRGVRVRSGGMGVLSIALVMFGLSEVVEVRMGAWYRPWWLLAWKGACLVTIVAVLVVTWRGRKRRGQA
jgi:hypothetical protein